MADMPMIFNYFDFVTHTHHCRMRFSSFLMKFESRMSSSESAAQSAFKINQPPPVFISVCVALSQHHIALSLGSGRRHKAKEMKTQHEYYMKRKRERAPAFIDCVQRFVHQPPCSLHIDLLFSSSATIDCVPTHNPHYQSTILILFSE